MSKKLAAAQMQLYWMSKPVGIVAGSYENFLDLAQKMVP
jgi:hypothetical protein